jgi:hypothetical protein
VAGINFQDAATSSGMGRGMSDSTQISKYTYMQAPLRMSHGFDGAATSGYDSAGMGELGTSEVHVGHRRYYASRITSQCVCCES